MLELPQEWSSAKTALGSNLRHIFSVIEAGKIKTSQRNKLFATRVLLEESQFLDIGDWIILLMYYHSVLLQQ